MFGTLDLVQQASDLLGAKNSRQILASLRAEHGQERPGLPKGVHVMCSLKLC